MEINYLELNGERDTTTGHCNKMSKFPIDAKNYQT